jgi:hypothetical protein
MWLEYCIIPHHVLKDLLLHRLYQVMAKAESRGLAGLHVSRGHYPITLLYVTRNCSHPQGGYPETGAQDNTDHVIHVSYSMPTDEPPTAKPDRTERLPYNRIDDSSSRLALQERGAERARSLIETAPSSGRLYVAESLCRSISQLSAENMRDPVAASDFGDMPDFDAEGETDDGLVDESAVPSDTDLSSDRFQAFRRTVSDEGWVSEGIGPIRSLYYLAFLGSRGYESDLMNFGDFPRSPNGGNTGRLYPLDGVYCSRDAKDWLAYDLYLEDMLRGLGVSWLTVEAAMTHAFYINLPTPYRELLEGVPKPLWYVLWKHDLERWNSFERHGDRIEKAVNNLSALIWKTPFGPQYESGLENLRRIAAPAAWTVGEELRLRDRCVPGSPIVRAVYTTVAKSLWRAIQVHASVERDSPVPPSLARILRQAETSNERRPVEYWKLLADIFYHLPIIRGLPDQRRYVDEPPKRVPPHTQNAVRLIITRS